MFRHLRELADWCAWLASGLLARSASLQAEISGDPPLVHLYFSHPLRHLVLDADGARSLGHELLQAAQAIDDEMAVGGDAAALGVHVRFPAPMTRH